MSKIAKSHLIWQNLGNFSMKLLILRKFPQIPPGTKISLATTLQLLPIALEEGTIWLT